MSRSTSPPVTRPLLAAMTLLGLMAAIWIAIAWEPRLLPVRTVTITGELHPLSRTALQTTIAAQMSGGILTLDLSVLQTQIQALTWVADVSVQRRWPDRLVVQVTERQPLARWGAVALVTREGVVYRTEGDQYPPGLPQLSGADDRDASTLVPTYLDWQPRLAAVGLQIERLQVDQRGEWQLRLAGQLEVCLGTDDVTQRFERLLTLYPRISAVGRPARLDLRYSNGIAVRWLQPEDVQPPASQPPTVAPRRERMAQRISTPPSLGSRGDSTTPIQRTE